MSDTPVTDAIELAYWDSEANARDVFIEMCKMEARLGAECTRSRELIDGIKSILPKPPYHPTLEPEWVYLSGLVEGVGDISEDLFAQVEARKCFFSLYYEREKRSPLVDSGMIWRCGCGAPESYIVEGKTAKEAVEKALTRAAELESSDSHKRSRVPL